MTTAAAPRFDTASPKALHIALWVAQVLLAVAFGMAGVMKAILPMPQLIETMVWPGAVSPGLVRFIGVAELAAAIGLVLPAATRIKPILTPLAAIGLVLVMIAAAGFHFMRGELQALPINATLGALAAFVAWGRLRKAPIAPRAR
jgi:putative oxidoreductase